MIYFIDCVNENLKKKGCVNIQINNPLEQDMNYVIFTYRNKKYTIEISGLEELQNNDTKRKFNNLIDGKFRGAIN